MDQSGLAEPMASRRSAHVLDPDHELDDARLALLLEAARWAPSNGNAQPWRFVVLRRGGPGHDVLVRHLSRGNSWWVPRASAVVLAGLPVGPDETGEAPRKPAHAEHDLGQAVAHLALQATASGLAAHAFAGFDADAVARELGVPPWVRLLTGVAVGRPGGRDVPPEQAGRDQRPRRRRPLAETVHVGAWGTPWDLT